MVVAVDEAVAFEAAECVGEHLLADSAGPRTQFGEVIMGTDGTIEITVGTDDEPAIGLWFTEPKKAEVTSAKGKKEAPAVAGATLASTGSGSRALEMCRTS